MRHPDWQQRLVGAIEFHASEPFAWGRSDCFHLAADVVLAVTGEDRLGSGRGYDDAAGAARTLKRTGAATLGDAFGHEFEEVPPSLAGRGDIGVVVRDGREVACAFTGQGIVAKSDTGVAFEPVTAAARAFRVG